MARTISSVGQIAGLAFLLFSSPAHAIVHVVTTTQTFRDLAEQVGGDKIQATALVGDAIDPHFLDPKPSYALLLNRAQLLIFVGLDLEIGWLPPLLAQSRNPDIQRGQLGSLDASTAGISVLDVGLGVSRAQGDIHPLGNPHYWLIPENAEHVAHAIAARLAQLDPDNASFYDRRYRDFLARTEDKAKAWLARARGLQGVKVVTYHKSWTYLTAWLGMKEIGYVEPKPGVPPDPAHLAKLVQSARQDGARFVLVESYYPRNTAQRVAELGHMKLMVLPPDVTSQL
jgi:zinc/manganese transport system substrate-binding protein